MFRVARLVMALSAVLVCAIAPARAAPETSGLPLPRFVSLKSGEANLRAGPGLQYPVEWIYRRRGLPMEVINEYRHWRKVRDWQGDVGWMHKSMLSSRRTAVVVGAGGAMRAKPKSSERMVARLEPGVVAHIVTCPASAGVCRVVAEDYDGWVSREMLWGLQPGETLE